MNSITNVTLHAPAERASDIELKKQVNSILENAVLNQVSNSINIYLLIINQYRQIVYANDTFIQALGLKSYNQIIGKRPGEAISCINADSHVNGCGTSEACRYCNAVNIVVKSMKSGHTESGEISIIVKNKGLELPMNMFENATPFHLSGQTFYIVSMIDISDSQRRRMLERVFFHDIINLSGGLQGLVGALKDDVPEHLRTEVAFVEDAFKGMVEDIIEQRQILEAENNEIIVEEITLDSEEVIINLVKLYHGHIVAMNKNIVISEDSEKIEFKSDYMLLRRVLGNMIKNAFEATSVSQTIKIGCRKKIILGTNYIEFWVSNKEYIPPEIQHQIFQRSFSTKSKSRGIGTYSIKLFGEKYLNGKVGFESTEEAGTRFYIRLFNG